MAAVNTYELLKSITISGIMDANLHRTTLVVQGLALLLAPILFTVNIMHNFWGTTTSFSGQLFNTKELVRLWVVYGFIVLYPVIFTPVMGLIDLMNSAAVMDDESLAEFDHLITDYASNHIKYDYASGSQLAVTDLKKNDDLPDETTTQAVTMDILGVGQVFNWVINTCVSFLASIAHLGVGVVAIVLFKVLYVLGPMAFCFSLSPFSTNQIDVWLGRFLNTGFVLFTLNILERLLANNLVGSKALMADGQPMSPQSDALFGIVIIILNILAFWLTSCFVGSGDGGKVLSTAMQALQTAATLGGSGAASVAQSMGGAAGDAAKAGADSMKNQ